MRSVVRRDSTGAVQGHVRVELEADLDAMLPSGHAKLKQTEKRGARNQSCDSTYRRVWDVEVACPLHADLKDWFATQAGVSG